MNGGKVLEFRKKFESKTSPKTLEELVYRIKTCKQPRELSGLIDTLDPNAGKIVSMLFDSAFKAGVKRAKLED